VRQPEVLRERDDAHVGGQLRIRRGRREEERPGQGSPEQIIFSYKFITFFFYF
jgi:hypothetical protein